MSIRKRDVHFSDWTKVRHALVCNNVHGITETSSFDDVRTFLINSESGSNPFYYYVCYIKETKEIYTHGQFYDCLKSGDSVIPEKIEELESTLGTKVDLTVFEELQSDVKENELVTARALTELNEKKADSVDLNAIKAEIEENEKVAAKAFMDLNERKLDKKDLNNIDLSNYVDWDTYYNNLNSTNSAINLKANKTTVDLLQTTVYLKANQTDLNTLSSKVNLKANQTDLDTLSAEVDLKANKSDLNTLSESLNTLSAEVEENEDVTAAALTELHENKADKTDLEDYAKKDDLNTKQDQLVSGTTIKTVNGNSILGSGNIETPDTKVTSADNHYGYNSDNATSTTGAFVTKITKDAANHVTSFESRALISTDIPELDASKITSGEISIDRLPKGALERLFVVESEAAAISATVQEGDVVQVTGNNNKMYFCISNTATTFATKFKEFTAGTATSVPWSGITGKPTGIDGWGDRIGVIESGYATQSWVGDNYLSKSGGTLSGSNRDLLSLDTLNTSGPRITLYENGNLIALIGCVPKQTTTNYGAYFVNVSSKFGVILGNDKKAYITLNTDTLSKDYQILHSGNYSDYALSVNGGTVKGSITANSFIGNLTGNADSANFVAKTYANENINFAKNESKIRLVSGVASNSTDLGFPKQYTAGLSVVSSYCGWQMVCYGSNIDYNPYYRSVADTGTWGHWRQIAFLTDNVASATKLATPRTIWGQSFDGTGNITGAMTIDGTVTSTSTFSGTDFITTSDNRLKDFVSDIYVDFESLKQIPKKYYYWKDKSMGEDLQIGTSAQELAKVYPECVHYDETNDRYSVNYQKLSIVALAAIDKLHDRVSELESKLYDKNN